MSVQSVQQAQLWNDEKERLMFAELVNVFYSREISALAAVHNEQKLRKSLASLPFYVERAARHIVQGDIPLELDSQNGGWLAPQKKLPSPDLGEITSFFKKYAKPGLVIPVLKQHSGYKTLTLDCIDQVDKNSFHSNLSGWFFFSGASQSNSSLQVLKPSKQIMTAACCGHQWQFKKAVQPRRLSLREMLLASMINWKNVRSIKRNV
tara:strand:- start:496 stop:1116 length:621 start_codon:yes stop_codon:yes gene_type:complete